MATEDERKLFVAGLPDSITEQVLRQLFEATGSSVQDVSIPKDRATGRPRGFGFVTLSSPEEAVRARESLDGSLQAGRPISVRPFQSEAPRRGEAAARSTERERGGSDRTLYIGNLPYDCSQQQVEELFTQSGAGPIVRVHLPTGPEGRLRGFGFVTMGSVGAAAEAIEALRGAELLGRRLLVKVARPRAERSDRPPPSAGERPNRGPHAGRDSPSPGPRGQDGGPPGMDPQAGFAFFDEPPRAPEGRRRAERPERSEKKKKRGRGRDDRLASSPRRSREQRPQRDADDWDED